MDDIIQGKYQLNEQDKESVKEFFAGGMPEDQPLPLEGYWAKVFQHCAILKEELGENDLPILAHLTELKIMKEKDSSNYSLVFKFSENEFFENSELRKRLIFGEDENNADYSEGTEIDWKDGKDVTVKKIQKKQKNKKTGATRMVEKTEEAHSFFNFFKDFDVREDHMEDLDDEEADKMDEKAQIHMEIADQIKEEAIPFSLQYYLGVEQPACEDDCEEDCCDVPGKKAVKA